MDVMVGIIILYGVFFTICAIISFYHRIRHKQWPDGEDILADLTKPIRILK